jgi:hypothetical protein
MLMVRLLKRRAWNPHPPVGGVDFEGWLNTDGGEIKGSVGVAGPPGAAKSGSGFPEQVSFEELLDVATGHAKRSRPAYGQGRLGPFLETPGG